MTISATIEQAQGEFEQASQRAFAETPPSSSTDISALGTTLASEFSQAMIDRRQMEERWLRDLRQFRGVYDADVLARIGPNRSSAFVRKTRVKVKTVDSKMDDFLFPSNGARNWSLSPTPKPSIAPEQKQAISNLLKQATGKEPLPDALDAAVADMAKKAAAEMTKTIDDQLAECKYRQVSKQVVHSGNLYGTGIMKAPLIERKIKMRYALNAKGEWEMKSESFVVPFVDFVPLWRWFPDMSVTELAACRYAYERHLLSKMDLGKLAERKSFDKAKITDYILSNPDGRIERRYYDSELREIGDRTTQNDLKNGQYEVLERWGWLDATQLLECGIKVNQDRMHESFFSNVWLFPDGTIIKAVLQPINGVTWPYHIYYYDKDETNIFAEGLASIMRDEQENINASTRMMFDNAAITAGPQIEANMRLLSPTEKADEIFPFKIWPRTGEDAASPALRIINIDSHVNELQGLVEMSHTNSDEITAVPRYAYGENVTQGAAGTASGLSMLQGNQNLVMKDQFMSYDQGVTSSFIGSMYHWNMQFSKNPKIKGDYDVVCTGTLALMAKEIRGQQLDAFAAQVANPMDAPFIKRDALLRQRAEAHDLIDVVKTLEEVEQEQSSDAVKQAGQLQQAMAQLQLATAQAQLGKLQADIANLAASTAEKAANALAKRLSAAYAAMEAAGIAVQNPSVAAAGDELLRAAGWTDQGGAAPNVPVQPIPTAGGAVEQPQEAGQVPLEQPAPGTGMVGMNRGMETARLTDGQP